MQLNHEVGEVAPVILFVFKRLEPTLQVLEALAKNDLAASSTLYIFCDGPAFGASAGEREKIDQVRAAVARRQWCGQVYIHRQEINLGLANSIISGVTQVINKHGAAIVLEDDIVPTPFFLSYMNDALRVYQHAKKVWSIGALNFFAHDGRLPETFFTPIPDCWGWATWADRWARFETDGAKLLSTLQEHRLTASFNLHGRYDFEGMLRQQVAGQNDSWAIRWQACAYLHHGLTLYPKESVTTNIGMGEGATHTTSNVKINPGKVASKKVHVQLQPVVENRRVSELMLRTYERMNKTNSNAGTSLFGISKALAKEVLPPIIVRALRSARGATPAKQVKPAGVTWTGNYASWDRAKERSTGYDSKIIFERTAEAVLKVKRGEARYERDSVIFDKPEYSWPLIALLLRLANQSGQRLNVVDFGGSLGSTYFQIRDFFSGIQVQWSIVEQEHYINFGNQNIADESLKFYFTIDDCVADRHPNVLLLSGVIQCLENPWEWIDRFVGLGFDYILFDRTAFIDGEIRLTVQHVPESIYPASYPAWFFNRDQFVQALEPQYRFVLGFNNGFTPDIRLDGKRAYWNGLLFERV